MFEAADRLTSRRFLKRTPERSIALAQMHPACVPDARPNAFGRSHDSSLPGLDQNIFYL